MLTYEEKDSKWGNWDGGYWGKDIYKKKNHSSKLVKNDQSTFNANEQAVCYEFSHGKVC